MFLNDLLGSQFLVVLQCHVRKCEALSDSLPVSLIFVNTQHHLEPLSMESNFDLGIVFSYILLNKSMVVLKILSGLLDCFLSEDEIQPPLDFLLSPLEFSIFFFNLLNFLPIQLPLNRIKLHLLGLLFSHLLPFVLCLFDPLFFIDSMESGFVLCLVNVIGRVGIFVDEISITRNSVHLVQLVPSQLHFQPICFLTIGVSHKVFYLILHFFSEFLSYSLCCTIFEIHAIL